MLASVLQPPNLSIVKVLDTIATTRIALALCGQAAESGVALQIYCFGSLASGVRPL